MVTPVDSPQLFQFGVFEVDRRAHELRKQGARIRLQEQPFQVLVVLLERAGEVVTREELREKLWPSSVFVDFDHGLNNAIAKLREALGDSAAAPHFVETLPRLGYRFIYPLAVPAAGDADDAGPAIGIPASSGFRWTGPRQIIAAGLTTVIVTGLLAGLWRTGRLTDAPTGTTALPTVPSVAVLPFTNMSPDAENEYFADGLSEELANKLAGIQGLKVASQTSSFSFKGKREPAPVIAQALNVSHLLEGSVRQADTSVRISAQLIDAASGYHLWSDSFDRELDDIFQIQEDIAVAVSEALQINLLDEDHQRLRKHGTNDAEAYRLYLIAHAQMAWVFGKPDWAAVKNSLEAAIARDPQYAAAHAFLAHYHFMHGSDIEGAAKIGQAHAERAVALDPELSEALSARATFEVRRYLNQGDYSAYKRAYEDFRRALELDPSNDQASFFYAGAVLWNEPDLALRLFEQTLRLAPIRYTAEGTSAMLLSRQGRHDEARRRVRALYDRHPDKKFHNAITIAALATYLGELDEAVAYYRESIPKGAFWLPIHLWGLEMSLGDREAASDALDLANTRVIMALAKAARHCMEGRYAQAFDALERRRPEFPTSRKLDVPTARLALIVDRPEHAAAILEQRLPDLASGVEPVNGRNVLPALDLVAAWDGSGKAAEARELLDRAADFLDGSDAPRWPMFLYLRARAHALAGELQLAQQALDRAYESGFRQTWAIDIRPHSFLYVDPIHVDPAFGPLQTSASYKRWLERIDVDNARQLARLRGRDTRNATLQKVPEADDID